jgi:DNA topoisomerase IA
MQKDQLQAGHTILLSHNERQASEPTLIEAMQNAWRFVDDEILRQRLKEAKGIGTPATRAEIIGGLKKQ